MLFTTRAISDLLYSTSRMLEISFKDDIIHNALLADNFSDEKIDALKGIWDEANTKSELYKAAVDSQKEMRLAFEKIRRESNASYMAHVNMAFYICMDDPEKLTKFGLNSRRAIKFNAWLLQASDFYSRVLADPDLATAFDEKFGETVTNLEDGKKAVLGVNTAKETQNTAIGNSQSKREERDKALRKLFIAIRGFVVVLKRAMKINPQHLEKVGILVYTPGYKKKKKEEEPEEPPTGTDPQTTDPNTENPDPNPSQ